VKKGRRVRILLPTTPPPLQSPLRSSHLPPQTPSAFLSQHHQANPPAGLLSGILDPVGNVAGKALSPVGATVGAVTKPVTNTVGGVTKPLLDPVAGSVDDQKKGDGKIGGKEQTGQNPLGL